MERCHCEQCKHKLCASKVPIFANLEVEELQEVVDLTGHQQYNKGEMVFLEGTNLDRLFIINEGQVKLFKYTREGKEQILHILSEGDFFGELSLFQEEEMSFNAEAVTKAKICTLTKKDLDQILAKRPDIALKILKVVGQRLSKIENLVQNLATNDVEARIASLLMEFADRYGVVKPTGIEIRLPLTREDMANYIGVTRETISRKLSKLQEEGVIELIGNKKIRIIDQEALENY